MNALTTELHLAPEREIAQWVDHEGSIRRLVTPRVNALTTEIHLAPEREIAQWVDHEGSIRRPIAPRANALTTELHLAPEREIAQWVDHEGSIRRPVAPRANALTDQEEAVTEGSYKELDAVDRFLPHPHRDDQVRDENHHRGQEEPAKHKTNSDVSKGKQMKCFI